ncbi:MULTISPECIES: SLC13 family permease [unclassified Butyrivibrio]|uniref:SLC13 family permease n=1 Tax=unclassified Butyrivibrio TaxID=2639466 RepID=UPI00041C92E0|nr:MULTISPECIES: SLC13 family permease [unclassified Butyrivibrio]
MKTLAIILFVSMYVCLIAFPKRRAVTALIVAAIYVATGILPVSQIGTAVDWNVLLMIFGTLLLVDYFIESKMPNLIAEKLMDLAPNVMWVTIFMSLFSGLISAFIDNVATLLMVAPVGLAICKKLKINPVPMIISIAVSSNLQGAATLVGDTTSIMLAAKEYANMDFNDFFWMDGRLGIFFAVELGALLTVPIMMFLFRKDKEPVEATEKTVVKDYVPTIMMVAHVVLLMAASFIPEKPEITNGMICLICSLIGMVWEYFKDHDAERIKRVVKSLDYDTVLLLTGLFMVIGGVKNVGLVNDLANLIVTVGGNNLFALFTIVVWGSVLISAFIDNIPYVATMLPILKSVTATLGVNPCLLYFGLLCGATLGGNITPVGASCNIAGVGMLRKEGYEVSFKDFTRIGIPFTLAAVIGAYVFLWTLWR